MPPTDALERSAYWAIRAIRLGFDVVSGYAFGPITEGKLLRRILFLECLAGIPGMVAGSLRHLRSLRRVRRDGGWIHSLLAEAENERIHMLVFSQLKQPNWILQLAILIAQGVFWNFFFLAYLISPRFCHKFVGYLEEEAVHTYTGAIEALDRGALPDFAKMQAPPVAQSYWHLPREATMRDVLLHVRADEYWHKETNHMFAGLKPDDINPETKKFATMEQALREATKSSSSCISGEEKSTRSQ